jgi:hypothetical protein
MSVISLLRWQFAGYARYHQSRVNLYWHAALVPVFLVGNLVLVIAIFRVSLLLAAIGFAATMMSLVIQGRGHAKEAVPPEPFTGPGNAIARILLEQWITFPRFLISGGWLRALRAPKNADLVAPTSAAQSS